LSNRVIGGCMIAAGAMLSLTALGGGLCVGLLSLAGGAQADGLVAGVVIFILLVALSVGLILGGLKVERQGRDTSPAPPEQGEGQ
jgi:hypothetical protein